MREMLAGPLTSLAFCWRVERRDGAGFGLTSHDAALRIGEVDYSSEPGMVPAAIERGLGLADSDGEISGAITSVALDEADLVLGRWDGARVSLVAVDWERPETDTLPLMAGEIGEVRIEDSEYKAGLRGAAARLARSICPETSSECRAELGDKMCRVDLGGASAALCRRCGRGERSDSRPGDQRRLSVGPGALSERREYGTGEHHGRG